MKPRNLVVAAVLLVALSGLVWWSKKHPEAGQAASATTSSTKMMDIAAAQIKSITLVHKDGAPLVLEHASGKWNLTKPEPFATDQDAANSLVSALSPVTADNVVEEKATDLAKYGLSSPTLTVAAQDIKGKTTNLQFGDDVPGGSYTYARTGDAPRVYAVSSTVKSSFDKSANDLRDKRLLTFDSNTVTSIALNSPKGGLQFGKNNINDWQIVKPQPGRADSFQVEELLRKLTEAKMDLSTAADDSKKADAAFASGTNIGTAQVTSGSGTQTLDVHKSKDDYYARTSSVKGTYKVSADLGKQLEKTAEDYRNKKLFDFGFSDPGKLETHGAAGEKTYTRSGTDWKSDGKTMDAGTVQALIDKIRDLSAARLVNIGFTSTVFGITVVSNEGKRTERVEFSKAQDAYLARREGDTALYQIDTKTADEIVSAAKAIKPAATTKK